MQRVLGIIAGGGSYPRKIIQQCQVRKQPFCVLALEGQCDAETPGKHSHLWIPLGAVGKALKFLRAHNVVDIILAGNIERPSLAEIKPDFTGMIWLAKLATHATGDDSVLRSIAAQFENEGFRLIGSKDIFDYNFFMPTGLVTQQGPDATAQKDVARGIAILNCLGDQDVGQAIVVQQGIVLGIEGIEGTASLIQRCGELKRSGEGGVLVKLSKKNQDLRMDMPTVGPDTIDQVAAAGLKGLALEAGNVQMIDRDEVIKKANAAGLFMIGIDLNDAQNDG